MKFSSSLKFNAVAEWWDEYIAYEALKKHVYQLEKQKAGLQESYHDLEANERSALIGRDSSGADTDAFFVPLLDRELKKISVFYETEEQRLSDDITALQQEIAQHEENGPYAGHHYVDESGEDDDEDDDFELQSPTATLNQDQTQSPSRRRRRHSRSASNAPPWAGNRQPLDQIFPKLSDDEHEDIEASVASLEPNGGPSGTGVGRGSSKSPLVRARAIARTLKDSLISTTSSNLPESVWTARNNYAQDTQLLFKRKITNLYVVATSLKSYIELNYSGFRKILKKYDKVTESNLQDRYLHDVVEQAVPFQQASKDKLNTKISLLIDLYAHCVTRGDSVEARRQLKLHQREHIAWERNTVWRQMIGQARRGEDGGMIAMGGTLIVEPEKGLLNVQTPAGRIKLTSQMLYFTIAVVVFGVLLNVEVVDGTQANRCFAILVFATILWATEAIPLFVTSTLVPLLLVVLRVIRDGDRPLSAPDATKFVFSKMFSPTIMLLIGGFTIASAISKTAIDRVLITRVLSIAGERPSTVILAFMGVACFASMWISNVAAPTLCFTLVQPILRTLPPKSSFAPCLIIGIALAANIGGQSSPISSPQNLIAIGQMEPPLDWGSWFAVSLPVSAISIVLIWLLLLAAYRPARSPTGDGDITIKPIRPARERFSAKQWWVTFVCLLTIALWCVAHSIQEYIGDMGVIAIIPIVAFFSTGVLKKDDFEQFLWSVVFIAMGGIALGQGVTNSGLLNIIGDGIRHSISGMDLYPVVLLLSAIVVVISTFISHTIAAVLLVPIAQVVGKSIPGGDYSNLLIFITGLICSTGMGMPVSGFPNQTAATQVDEMGQLYLSNVDFLKVGVPASLIATTVVATVGYLLMRVIGI
ncbi:Sodium/sulfate symporter [Dichomitus squalens]|uniref:Sodium/sulfate symporter n=1 Tax=Dichomitus squalens TaxID=114155 RepID=A0A4Q9MLR4_9APHY|nr:Sodium/sulfate symporter [Dichomitus squalens]